MSANNRKREVCAAQGCCELTRAVGGLCVQHRGLPVEEVQVRRAAGFPTRVIPFAADDRAAMVKAYWDKRAQTALQATEVSQTVDDRTYEVNVTSSPVLVRGYTVGEWLAIGAIGLVALYVGWLCLRASGVM